MKIKAAHYWTTDGEVVVLVKDHESYERTESYWDMSDTRVRRVKTLATYRYPRGLAGSALRDAKRALVKMWETRLQLEQHS